MGGGLRCLRCSVVRCDGGWGGGGEKTNIFFFDIFVSVGRAFSIKSKMVKSFLL